MELTYIQGPLEFSKPRGQLRFTVSLGKAGNSFWGPLVSSVVN